MSDVFPGPGWWLASDGLWYEASTHPDPNYRAAFEADAEGAVESESTGDEPTEQIPVADVEPPIVRRRDFPSVEITPPHEVAGGDAAASGELGSVIRSAAKLQETEDVEESVAAVTSDEEVVAEESAAESEDSEELEETEQDEVSEEIEVPAGGLTFASGSTVPAAPVAVVEEIAPPKVPADPIAAAPAFELPVIERVDVADDEASGDELVPEESSAETVEPAEGDDASNDGDSDETAAEPDNTELDPGEPAAVVEEVDAAAVPLVSVLPEPSHDEPASANEDEESGDLDDGGDENIVEEVALDDVVAAPVAGGWRKIEPDVAALTPETPTPEPPPPTPRKSPRTQAEAFEEARRARLAEAQKSAEQLRDSVRRSRERDAELDRSGSSENGVGESEGTSSVRMRTPGAPLVNGSGPDVGSGDTASGQIEPPAPIQPPTVAGRTKLEIQSDTAKPAPTIGLVTAEPTQTTALVHVPDAAHPRNDGLDRVLSVLLFFSGLAMIAGTFMVWTTGSVDEVGWDRSDGIIVVVAGVVAATAAGPLFAGVRSMARGLAILAGVVAAMVVGVAALTTFSNTEETGLGIGTGLIVVLVAAIAAIITSSSIRNEPFY